MCQRVIRRIAIGFRLIFILTATAGCMDQVDPTAKLETGHQERRQSTLPLQATIDLGVIVQGKSVETNRWIRFQSDKPIRITKIEKSCECIDVKFPQMKILPGEKILAHISYDGAKEPEFVGSLEIEVKLFDEKNDQIGLLKLPVEIISQTSVEL
ncbi:MAG: hypothetical protein JWP89_1121 [Schlesneria sp.]|nr:hypothetical protein [Schlesneria sp.]